MPLDQVVQGLILSLIFAILGFILLFAGYKVFDALTPLHLSKQIFEEGNLPASVIAGAFVIAMAIVIAAAIHG